ncbi:MAG TPA: NADH-quinone oxidoreductase subunit L [Candidatus Tectomicrobia bacterium]|nr:NADH-quinone oxidoreductase subunit L [Candidatus Tectomicrobia bacterium]
MLAGSVPLALVVLGLPAATFVLLALVRPLRHAGRLAGIVSIAAMGAAFGTACALWLRAAPRAALASPSTTWSWIPADGGPMVTVGVMVDEWSMAMAVLVTLVSFLVQLYSLHYLIDEPGPGLGRYYAYHSLFAFSMLGLALAPGLVQMFVFWELVGLCSYLLIGFWYDRPSAARAAVKAFWITKLGDLGFVAGIVMLWGVAGTFDFWTLFGMARTGALPTEGLALVMGLIYLGAVGKSAQFPLHVWLPDAMEGPTPVSALIHAATMVTAGVFMVTRAYPLFALVPDVLTVIAWVGAFTALLAATMACVEGDIKRVLAYSTVSQLGYMMAAAGAGAPAAAFSHLIAHGVFKALLFLGAGVVIHLFHTNDVFRMGGLARLPGVWLPFVLATLALAGVWPLPGFFTKEAVLAGVLEGGLTGPFVLLAVGAFLTAFYMFRVVILAFFAPAHGGHHGHHHVPVLMAAVCWTLAALTVALGLHSAFVAEHHAVPGWLPWLSLALAGAGIALAWAMYLRHAPDPAVVAAALRPLDWMARRRYGLDAVFVAAYRVLVLVLARLVGWVDRYVVDGVVNLLSAWTLRAGDRLRRLQTGLAQDYVYGVALGTLMLLVLARWAWP